MRALYRYRYAILLLLFGGYLVAHLQFGLLALRGNPMQRNFTAIQSGMTVEEVTAILGEANFSDQDDMKVWTSRWGVISLGFRDGKVTTRKFSPNRARW